MLDLYIDGSIEHTPGGAIGFAVCGEEGIFLTGAGEAVCDWGNTKHVAELLAVLAAIEIASNLVPTTIITDSQYAVRQLTTRRARWEADAAKGKNPVNYELLCLVVAQLDKKPNISLRWQPGHLGHPGNKSSDFHARRLAEEARAVADHQASS